MQQMKTMSPTAVLMEGATFHRRFSRTSLFWIAVIHVVVLSAAYLALDGNEALGGVEDALNASADMANAAVLPDSVPQSVAAGGV